MTTDTSERKHQRAAVKAKRFKMLAGVGGAAAALLELVAWWLIGYAVPPSTAEQENADA